VWIPGKREPSWEQGGPVLQKGERGGSWFQTAEEKGRSNMATGAGDGLATASRDDYAQSECYCALYINWIDNYNRNRVSLYYCFRKINHLVPITICIHPLMFRKLCRAHDIPVNFKQLN
jgi:hypothetical protein